MKRKYIQPVSDVLRYDMEQSILAGSGLKVDKSGVEFDAESSYTGKKSIWDNSDWK